MEIVVNKLKIDTLKSQISCHTLLEHSIAMSERQTKNIFLLKKPIPSMLFSQVLWPLVTMHPPQAAGTTNSERWVEIHECQKKQEQSRGKVCNCNVFV
jgi:hypothetical protein